MSLNALSWVLDHSPATGIDRLVLLGLADGADEHGESHSTVDELTRWTGADTDATRAALFRLEQYGAITPVLGPWGGAAYKLNRMRVGGGR